MDSRETSLKILDLALSGENLIDMTAEERVKSNIAHLKKIQPIVSKIQRDKVGCERDDLECQRRCENRRNRSVNFLMVDLPKEQLQNFDLPTKIEMVLKEYEEIHKHVVLASDFFEGDDL